MILSEVESIVVNVVVQCRLCLSVDDVAVVVQRKKKRRRKEEEKKK